MDAKRLDALLHNMWEDYLLLNPDARKIFDMLSEEGETIVNDHIALRTYDHPLIGIDALAKFFTRDGYVAVQKYEFEEKKLSAVHFEHPKKEMPKVFISELHVSEFSDKVQKIIHRLVESMDLSYVDSDGFLYSGRPWKVDLTFEDYATLLKESEYAAWVAAFGYRPNHFTIHVNYLKNYPTLHSLNERLLSAGFKMNTVNGIIKGSPEDLLEQSSTLANKIDVNFAGGRVERIPSCYYEFAFRYKVDGSDDLYQGFVAHSADRIFESTDVKEQKKDLKK